MFDVFGMRPNQVTPSKLALLATKHPDDLATSEAVFKSVFSGTARFCYSHRIFRDDGLVRQVAASGHMDRSSSGHPGLFHVTVEVLSDWESPFAAGDISDASDGALMLGFRAQLPEALAEAFRRYSGTVDRVAHGQLFDGIATDDVVQDVFEALIRFPGRFDARRGSLGSYLAMHARSRSIDLLRSQGGRQRRESGSESIMQTPSAETEAMSAMSPGRIRSALAALPPEERIAIELAFLDGLTYKDVAECLRIPEGTAKTRIRRGLQRLGAPDGAASMHLARD